MCCWIRQTRLYQTDITGPGVVKSLLCIATFHILNFCLTLTNDSVVYYSYKVGKDIRYITPEGTEARIRYRRDLQHLQLEITLPEIVELPVVVPQGGAGFNAWVDEWEDGGTFDIGGF